MANYNVETVSNLIRELTSKFDLLEANPLMGRERPEIVIYLRSFPHKKYIIFYFPTENGIDIYRVLSGEQDVQHFLMIISKA